jgi:DNA-directed RNA polymerase subunit F
MKKLVTFFEAKTVLRKLNTSKNWRTLSSVDRREVRHLDKLRTLTRSQREQIAKIEASL